MAAIAVMGSVFGYYVVRLKSFDSIFAKDIKADFIVTTMYFGAAFISPATVSGKVMIWLVGIWILGMLLAPFDKERTLLKKITEYGSILHLVLFWQLSFYQDSKTFRHPRPWECW